DVAARGRVLILYGDVPLLRRETVEALAQVMDSGGHALAAVTMKLSDPTGYGRIVRDSAGRVARVVEHKDASPEERKIDEANAGIYLVEAEFL
ncbi:sugar phosphate nucleotidyltransferase, partial [Escherichia coli]|uniref:sugar phosphate nucleotidyltransferase n=1 Tax=Escherichia coli TaxID=562 RepID=UPI00200C3EC1